MQKQILQGWVYALKYDKDTIQKIKLIEEKRQSETVKIDLSGEIDQK